MISVIIASFKEPKTIGRAIESALDQTYKGNYEIIVSAPDQETLTVARSYVHIYKTIKVLQDEGKGKPLALNQAIRQARGSLLVLTDGDVYMSPNSLETLANVLKSSDVGGASARVLSLNSQEKLFGFWAYLLTEAFHYIRLKENAHGDNVLCSGYLYAIKKSLFRDIPSNSLADDAFTSLSINAQGKRTRYVPEAQVHVLYPSTLPDWISQKKRTAGRYYQLNGYFNSSKIKPFIQELSTLKELVHSLTSFKKVVWFLALAIMRLYIWFRIFFDVRLWNRSSEKTWQRVESTK